MLKRLKFISFLLLIAIVLLLMQTFQILPRFQLRNIIVHITRISATNRLNESSSNSDGNRLTTIKSGTTSETNLTNVRHETSPTVPQYVSFDGSIYDGRRLGNQMFAFAAVVFVAELTGRKPVLRNSSNMLLEQVFQLKLERVEELCPCHTIGEKQHLAYDRDTEKKVLSDPKLGNKTILVKGFRQSWKYTLAIDRRLRRHLVFKQDIRNFAEDFLERNIPPGWNKAGYVRVAIHIRRGDNLKQYFVNYGYTVPNDTYFQKAMKYFTDKYSRVQFILASDDYSWAKGHVVDFYNISSVTINVTQCSNHTAGQDLAILSMCDHVIMSTGTYGWWVAWLAKGTTIYYRDWPRKNTGLDRQFNREDFFPPNWIPLGD